MSAPQNIEAQQIRVISNDVGSLNRAFQLLSDRISQLEGRKGAVRLLNALDVRRDPNAPVTDRLDPTHNRILSGQDSAQRDTYTELTTNTGGTIRSASLTKDAKISGNSSAEQFQAQSPAPVILRMNDSGFTFYFDSGKSQGQFYSPTSVDQLPRPFVIVTHSVNQQFGVGPALGAATFDTDLENASSIHSTSVQPTRLTATRAGMWAIFGHVRYDANTTGGYRLCDIKKNGTTFISTCVVPPSGTITTDVPTYTERRLLVGDYVELFVGHDSTSNLNIQSQVQFSPIFGMRWLSP